MHPMSLASTAVVLLVRELGLPHAPLPARLPAAAGSGWGLGGRGAVTRRVGTGGGAGGVPRKGATRPAKPRAPPPGSSAARSIAAQAVALTLHKP